VHGTTDVPQLLGVSGVLLECQPGFVHALENLLGTLEKKFTELGGLFVGGKTHWAPSIRW
jgi:hypothetical protein